MPAYMIFTREGPVTDPAAMEAYGGLNRANAGLFMERYGIKPLAVYGAMETLEGKADDGMVLLEFPTADDARAWYNSPEYQASAEHRKRGASYRAVLIEGL